MCSGWKRILRIVVFQHPAFGGGAFHRESVIPKSKYLQWQSQGVVIWIILNKKICNILTSNTDMAYNLHHLTSLQWSPRCQRCPRYRFYKEDTAFILLPLAVGHLHSATAPSFSELHGNLLFGWCLSHKGKMEVGPTFWFVIWSYVAESVSN